MQYKNNTIGIFDSGVGGLTVVKEIMKKLPQEKIIYFGDTARAPYGNKNKNTIDKYSIQIVNFLLSKNVDAIIIACNSICAVSYNTLKEKFNIPIIEIITSASKLCVDVTKNNKIGVIATEATINSKKYEEKILSIDPSIEVYSKTCPLFVPIIEEGWYDNEVANLTCEIYLKELLEKNIDTLLLGCTHYPILKNSIIKVCPNLQIVNPAEAIAMDIKNYFTKKEYLNNNLEEKHEFYVSGNTDKFDKICENILNKNFKSQKIDIEQY